MTVYEMEGFLRGKCMPGDMKVNESNAQYLVRKFSEFESNLSESKREFRAADATIHNLELKLTDLAVQLANAESKCRELAGLVAENADLKSLIEQHACSIAVCPNCSHEEPSETDDIVALYRSLKTPFTDAFLAEVRAQGVERMIEVKQQQLDGMHPDTFAIGAV
ncbi:TPA: hNH endonuclease, partial [Citrobacter freundii]|nr:hNH endonuclease [Citrobacter freundii]HAT2229588.1 hNH endonuclease [Citrobacter freundii]HAT2570282.1 hNH endonuclease [Citrobacter freundii]HAT2590494.1 hNH endonuclease [Citrobacter freundii]HAT3368086.1 hNH endonuclease [Citrobacter freundii]